MQVVGQNRVTLTLGTHRRKQKALYWNKCGRTLEVKGCMELLTPQRKLRADHKMYCNTYSLGFFQLCVFLLEHTLQVLDMC